MLARLNELVARRIPETIVTRYGRNQVFQIPLCLVNVFDSFNPHKGPVRPLFENFIFRIHEAPHTKRFVEDSTMCFCDALVKCLHFESSVFAEGT